MDHSQEPLLLLIANTVLRRVHYFNSTLVFRILCVWTRVYNLLVWSNRTFLLVHSLLTCWIYFFFNEALFDFCCLISFVSFSPFYLSLFHFRFYFLLGSGCSGKTTFLKQLRILYGDGYTEKERKEFKPVIYGNVRRAMIRILEAMEEIGLTFTNEELSTKVIQCCGR